MRTFAWLGILLLLPLSGCLQDARLFDDEHLPAALLRSDVYRDLVVEIDHAPGAEPCPQAIHALEGTLLALTDKRSVRIVGPEPIPAGDGSYTNPELEGMHRRHADHGPNSPGRHGQGEAAHLHIVFLNGKAPAASGGHSAGRTMHDLGAIFVFPDAYASAYTFDRHLRRDASCDVERTVLLHELGHAFGLVNRGIPALSDREADDHAGHSTNPNSVMYPVLRLARDGLLRQDLPRGFDRDDVVDLVAFRQAA